MISFHNTRIISFCFWLVFLQVSVGQENGQEVLDLEKDQINSLDSLNSTVDKVVIVDSTITTTTFKSPSYFKIQQQYSIPEVTNPKITGTGYISDPNDYITVSEEEQLNSIIWSIEQKSTAQIAVVILPSIGTEIPKNFAVDLFKEWGIGQADTDNGLLILTIMDQRRTEFEVGYGLEPILTDLVCYRIGMNEIVPNFKQGNYGQGLIESIKKVELFLNDPAAIEEIYSYNIEHSGSEKPTPGKIWMFILGIYGIICSLFFIGYYGIAYDIERSKDDFYDKYQRLKKLKVGCLLFLFPIPLAFFSSLIKKRLNKYRYAPRFSSVNGKALFLKDEWAENEFLEKAQILEESLEALRYDVWVAEDESDILVLEYEGSSRKYSDCNECGYKTFGKTKTEVLKTATYNRSGERKINYNCRNCHYNEDIIQVIPQRVRHTSSSGSSSFGGGSSGGSSSFGGGSSGGGGAGVSW
jgi:uncharacterized protein